MKQIDYFYLEHCPHCKNADRMIEQLMEQHPEYRGVNIAKIEEKQNPLIAEKFDYFYVPCFFIEGVKVHEGVPTPEKVEKALKIAAGVE